MDLICTPSVLYSTIYSVMLLGYILGAVLFPMPDIFGRKKVIRATFLIQIVTNLIIVFGNSMTVKAIGFFFYGFFHTKNSVCFVYLYEIVED